MPILCVIDMQRAFRATWHPGYRRSVCRLIRWWPGPVCLVECNPDMNGKTYPGIVRAVKSKERHFRCLKDYDDGGDVIAGATYGEGLGNHKHYYLCGVNTGFCVTNTASGLLHYRSNSVVKLLMNYCRDQSDDVELRTSWTVAKAWQREDDYRGDAPQRRYLDKLWITPSMEKIATCEAKGDVC